MCVSPSNCEAFYSWNLLREDYRVQYVELVIFASHTWAILSSYNCRFVVCHALVPVVIISLQSEKAQLILCIYYLILSCLILEG